MALRDYRTENEDEYYGQGFRSPGVVSIWISSLAFSDMHPDTDALQDLCGIGYYSLDEKEMVGPEDGEIEPIDQLLARLSYFKSFHAAALAAARRLGNERGRWALAQYEFAYDPAKITRPTSPEIVFLGVFPYAIPD